MPGFPRTLFACVLRVEGGVELGDIAWLAREYWVRWGSCSDVKASRELSRSIPNAVGDRRQPSQHRDRLGLMGKPLPPAHIQLLLLLITDTVTAASTLLSLGGKEL